MLLFVYGRNGVFDQVQIVEIVNVYLLCGWCVVVFGLLNLVVVFDFGLFEVVSFFGYVCVVIWIWDWVVVIWFNVLCVLVGYSIGGFVVVYLVVDMFDMYYVLVVFLFMLGFVLMCVCGIMGVVVIEEVMCEVFGYFFEMVMVDVELVLNCMKVLLVVVIGVEDGLVLLKSVCVYFMVVLNGCFFVVLFVEYYCFVGLVCVDMLLVVFVVLEV